MKRISLKFFVLLFCYVLYIFPACGQYNWKLTRDQDGIKIFESSKSNSDYRIIKVECSMRGSLEALVDVVADIAHHKDWIFNVKDAFLLKKIGPNEVYYYTETNLPWPMSNRYAVAHMKIKWDTVNHFVDIVEVDDPKYIPEKNGLVRVTHFSTNWHVTMSAANRLNIIYILELEPGGSVPAWVANLFLDKGPFESFKKLAEVLKHRSGGS